MLEFIARRDNDYYYILSLVRTYHLTLIHCLSIRIRFTSSYQCTEARGLYGENCLAKKTLRHFFIDANIYYEQTFYLTEFKPTKKGSVVTIFLM